MPLDLILILNFLVGLTGVIMLFMALTGKIHNREQTNCIKKVEDMKRVIGILQDGHVADQQRINELEKQQAAATLEIQAEKIRIRALEERLSRYECDDPATADFPLLVIGGPDDAIMDDDLAAIRQARVAFKRIRRATRPLIEDELLRRREAGDLYRWLHVASHAGPAGIVLADGLAERAFWSETLTGIEGVFLAGCTDVAIADWLVGQVSWVLSTTEEIRSAWAGRFAKAFWETLATGKSPRLAYQAACRVVPQFAEYTDFREVKR